MEAAKVAAAYLWKNMMHAPFTTQKERQNIMVKVHIYRCITIMQDTDTQPIEYTKIEVPMGGGFGL